ncbi:MAG: Histone acetyltransferase type B subunit 2 [Bathelium mastoideum]|nr:MAG: Histone acetyltransferase type B subunit 2 [Bathelium mastoideum]
MDKDMEAETDKSTSELTTLESSPKTPQSKSPDPQDKAQESLEKSQKNQQEQPKQLVEEVQAVSIESSASDAESTSTEMALPLPLRSYLGRYPAELPGPEDESESGSSNSKEVKPSSKLRPLRNAVDAEEAPPSEEAIMQQQIINEEYKTWKKNAPLIYDFILTRALEWPTLTVQWLPDKQALPDKHFSTHRLLIGTHTSDDQPNYLQIANVQLPNPRSAKASDYDEEREEIGGYTLPEQPITFNVIQKIPHPGEVNKARYQPQNPNLVTTWCQDGRVLFWDRTKHESDPGPNAAPNPQAELKGHEKEGFGMSWSPVIEGQLATSGEDQTVRVWDIKDYSASSKVIEPKNTYYTHSSTVNDVQHHPTLSFAIGSVSDDCTFKLIDTRVASTTRAAREAHGHTDAVNALAWHPEEEVLFATGSADHTVRLWDLRNLKMSVGLLESHFESVQTVEWDPHHYHVIASAGQDRRVMLWDLSKIGDEQTPEDAEDGPPELSFMHAGHTAPISEFSWNKSHPWVFCSASEDNLIEIWQPAKPIVSKPVRKAAQADDSAK